MPLRPQAEGLENQNLLGNDGVPHIAVGLRCSNNAIAIRHEVGALTLGLAIRRVEVHEGAALDDNLSGVILVVVVNAVQQEVVTIASIAKRLYRKVTAIDRHCTFLHLYCGAATIVCAAVNDQICTT